MSSVEDRGGVLSTTLSVFEGSNLGTPMTTSEVASHLDCSRRATYDRLERLVDRGDVRTKKVGAKGRVWWRPHASGDGDAGSASAEDGTADTDDATGTDDGTVNAAPDDATGDVTDEGDGSGNPANANGEIASANGETASADGDDDYSEALALVEADDAGSPAPPGGGSTAIDRSRETVSRLVGILPGMVYYRREAEPGWPTSFVSPGCEDLTGYPKDDLESDRVRWDEDVVHSVDRRRFREELGDYLAEGRQYAMEYRIRTADGEVRWMRDVGRVIHGESPILEGVVVDVSDQRDVGPDRDAGRDDLDEVFERIDDAFIALDHDFRFTYANERAEALLRTSEEGLLGEVFWDRFPGSRRSDIRQALHEAQQTQEAVSLEHCIDGWRLWVEVNVYPSESGLSVYFRDISGQKEFERTLTGLHETSRDLLAAGTDAEVSETVVEAATEVLDLDGVVVYRYDDERDALTPVARSVGADFVRREFPELPADEDNVLGRTFLAGDSTRYDDLRELPDRRVEGGEMRGGLFAPMADHGVVVAGARETGSFDGRTLRLLEILAANAEAAFDRVARERELARQRERLAALDELNAVVRDINEALIEQSTREEIESVVCDRLADAASYEFAWIGEVGRRGDELTVRAGAGVEDGLDDLAVSMGPDGAEGPTARALHSLEMQVATVDGSADEQCQELAAENDCRAMAAIPVTYEDFVYGVLNVYAAREEAFVGEERAVVGQLGDVVGHAINAIERRQALMTDDVTEVQLRIRDLFEEFGIDLADEGAVTFEEFVPVGEGEFLMYGSADDDAVEDLAALEEEVPAVEEVEILDRGDGETRFEQRMSEPPVISLVAAQGGDVRGATIEDGDYHLTVHLPPNVDVRDVIEKAQAAYPPVEMVARRQVSRSAGTGRDPDQHGIVAGNPLLADLSERQRAAMLAAYHSGFFDWPRDSSGEEVADSLDVSPSTFHQHVRIAEKKLLQSLLSEGTA